MLLLDLILLILEARLISGGVGVEVDDARCRRCIILVTRNPPDEKFAGWVDVVAVDHDARISWAKVVVNKYVGKSGAIMTVLEELDCDAYVFVDDDVEPGPWIGMLAAQACKTPVTVYRWITNSVLGNAFSLGAVDWLVLTPFLWGGGMGIPGKYRRAAIEALRGCLIDDFAITSIVGRPKFLYILVPSVLRHRFTDFAIRQAASAKWGNRTLWILETTYYVAWSASLVISIFLAPPIALSLLVVHGARLMLRARAADAPPLSALAVLGWDRIIMASVFLASMFVKRVRWGDKVVDLSKCAQHLRYTRTKFSKAAAFA